MEPICIYCKHHRFALSEFDHDGITVYGVDDCYCAEEHNAEHNAVCSVFDAKNLHECLHFEEGSLDAE